MTPPTYTSRIARDAPISGPPAPGGHGGHRHTQLDHGPSRDFIAHQIERSQYAGLENVANLERLPEPGLSSCVADEIAAGSGGPCRIVALLDR